jgi:hypothetical protein
MNKKGKPQRGRSLFLQLMGRLRKDRTGPQKDGLPMLPTNAENLAETPGRPRHPGLHPAIQLASGGLQGCRLGEPMAQFPLPRACDRCGFGERTFAGTRGSDGNAPTPAVRPTTASRLKSTLSGHSAWGMKIETPAGYLAPTRRCRKTCLRENPSLSILFTELCSARKA